MRVINVVEMSSGILDSITSFGVIDEQLVDDVVEEAEKHYVKCCRDHKADEDEYTDEELIDMETYDYGNYSVCIHWSDIENIQI
jgi:hypothetical protein